MRCADFERRLQQMLDDREEDALRAGQLSPAANAHLAECDDCCELLSGYRTLMTGLESANRPVQSAGFVEKVLVQSQPVQRTRRLPHWFAPLATAASIAVVGLLSYLVMKPAEQPVEIAQPVEIVQPVVERPAIPVEVAVTPAVSETARILIDSPTTAALVTDKPQEVIALASRRVEIDPASLGVMLNLAGLRPVTFSAGVLEAHIAEKPAWMVEVADGLKPVTETMTGTLNALLRVLPTSSPSGDEDQGARYDRHSRYSWVA